MNYEGLKRGCYLVVFALGVTLAAYLFMKYVFLAVLPFLVAWCCAFAVRPLAARLSPKLRIKSSILRVLITVALVLILLGLITLGVWALSRELWGFLNRLGSGEGELYSFLSDFIGSGGALGRVFGGFGEYVTEGVYKLLASFAAKLAGVISSVATAIPRALFFALITVISAIYFSLDLEKINQAVKNILPPRAYRVAVRLKDGFITAFSRYIRSYLILLCITFLEMLAGLFIVGAPYPLLMAGVIAALDLLPVVGVGAVLIPWGVWCFIAKNTALGIGLIVLFVAHTVLRQMIEPRIVGKSLGVHPILTLVFIYTGYTLFGVVGILLVPMLTVLVNITFSKDDATEVSKSGVAKADDT